MAEEAKVKNRNMLVWLILGLCVLMSLFTLWLVFYKKSVSSELQGFKDAINNIKPINGKDVTLDQVAEVLVKYCEGRNSCAGLQGAAGTSGADGKAGKDGVNGKNGANGVNGRNGIDGEDGVDGAPGAIGPAGPVGPQGPQGPQGRTLEERCVVVDPTTRRIEQKYTDTETWEVKYYLSPGQLCPEEV